MRNKNIQARSETLRVISFLALFISYCSYPYLFIIDRINLVDHHSHSIQFHSNIVYLENKNNCWEYNIIFNPELKVPFLPSERSQFENQKTISLLQQQYFWIRFYFKNIYKDSIEFSLDLISLEDQNKNYSLSFEEIYKSPYFIDQYPLFWYALPKKPSLYLYKKNDWYQSLYGSSLQIKNKILKFEYYKKYFEKLQKINLQNNEEILFYLPFQHLEDNENQNYNLKIKTSNHPKCEDIIIPFKYFRENKDDITYQIKEKEKLYRILNQQNKKWEKDLEEDLKRHIKIEKTFIEKLFELFE